MKPAAIVQQFRSTAWPHLRRRPGRDVLAILSIATAVAMFVSMRSAQVSLLAAFESNLDAMAGRAEWRITSAQHVAPDVLRSVETIPGVRAAPVIQGSVVLADKRTTVAVLGIDPIRDAHLRSYRLDDRVQVDIPTLLTDPDAVIVPRSLADRLGLSLRSKLELIGAEGRTSVTIAGTLASQAASTLFGGNLLITSIPTAQRVLGRGDRYDRIDFALDDDTRLDDVRDAAAEHTIAPARGRDPTFEHLYRQFQVLLVVISLIGALIGLFIVYNAVSLSVVERAPQIGILRALGARRSEILAVFGLEAALAGLIAALLGILAGRAVASAVLAEIARTLSLIIELGAIRPIFPADLWPAAALLGVLTAVVGAVVPAAAASRISPVDAMKAEHLAPRSRGRWTVWLAFAIGTVILSMVLIRHPGASWNASIVGVALAFASVVMAGPTLIRLVGRAIRVLLRRSARVPTLLALENLLSFPSRTSLTTVAFGGSLALVVGMGGLMKALERDIIDWMHDIFVFDITVQMADMSSTPYASGTMPGSLIEEIRRDPQCREAYAARARILTVRDDDVMLVAYDAAALEGIRIERGRSSDPQADRRLVGAMQSGAIGISENLAVLSGLRVGDSLELETPSGPRTFPIAGIRRDHTWFRGVILMDLAVYQRHWNDARLTFIDVRLKDGADADAYRATLTRRWSGPYGVFVYRCDELIEAGLKLVREWFTLADTQLLLAVLVGGVGVANTLLISVLTQRRQIALLRAIGASDRQVRRMIVTEAAFLGVLSGAIGCALGLFAARYVAAPLVVKLSGVVLPFAIPWRTIGAAIAAALIISLCVSLLPLRAIRRINIVEAIGYE